VKAVITGIGWVTPTNMGCGRDHGCFEIKPGNLPEITRKAVFNEPYPHFGRLDRYSRLGLSAIAFALKDAGLYTWTHKRQIGIIASTVQGCLGADVKYFDTVMPDGGRLASPNLFAYTLPNSFLGEASIRFGLTGTCFTVSEPLASRLWCLRMALIGIAGSQFEKVLGGICDLGPLPPFTDAGKTAGGALFFVLEKSLERDRLSYGELCLDKNGILKFNGNEVKNPAGLAQSCVATLVAKIEKHRDDDLPKEALSLNQVKTMRRSETCCRKQQCPEMIEVR
jgi:3-oxoacyl-[acyl-carrier-protein] synthase II